STEESVIQQPPMEQNNESVHSTQEAVIQQPPVEQNDSVEEEDYGVQEHQEQQPKPAIQHSPPVHTQHHTQIPRQLPPQQPQPVIQHSPPVHTRHHTQIIRQLPP